MSPAPDTNLPLKKNNLISQKQQNGIVYVTGWIWFHVNYDFTLVDSQFPNKMFLRFQPT